MIHPEPSIGNFVRSYGWLLIVATLLAAFSAAYVLAGVTASGAAQLIASHTMPICFVTWFQADARAHRRTPCFDFGMFVLAAWLVAVPCYLIWTRGWRGLLVALMFFGLSITPPLTATLAWILSATVASS